MKIELCASADIPARGTILLPFFGREIHVWHDGRGRARAAVNACLRFRGPPESRGCQILCSWHGAACDLDAGDRVDGAGRPDARLMFLPTREEDGAHHYVREA